MTMVQPSTHVYHVIQGQFCLSKSADEVLSTLLGSCVSACMRDPVIRLGGMNHFLLPGSDPNSSSNVRYGAHSMEELVNAILRNGGRRERLEVWLFGGASVVAGLGRIGEANSLFAKEFVKDEGFFLRGSDLGGKVGRKIRFNAFLGHVEVEKIASPIDESIHADSRVRMRSSSAVELF